MEKAALGLAGANLTVLNGSEGVTEVVSSLVGQGLAILESVKRGVGNSVEVGRQQDRSHVAPSGRVTHL